MIEKLGTFMKLFRQGKPKVLGRKPCFNATNLKWQMGWFWIVSGRLTSDPGYQWKFRNYSVSFET